MKANRSEEDFSFILIALTALPGPVLVHSFSANSYTARASILYTYLQENPAVYGNKSVGSVEGLVSPILVRRNTRGKDRFCTSKKSLHSLLPESESLQNRTVSALELNLILENRHCLSLDFGIPTKQKESCRTMRSNSFTGFDCHGEVVEKKLRRNRLDKQLLLLNAANIAISRTKSRSSSLNSTSSGVEITLTTEQGDVVNLSDEDSPVGSPVHRTTNPRQGKMVDGWMTTTLCSTEL